MQSSDLLMDLFLLSQAERGKFVRPSRELVGLNVVAIACLALLIVIAGIQIQVRLTGVVMLMVCIQSNAVIRIGVGEDGQIGGVVCIQLSGWCLYPITTLAKLPL